MDFTTVPINLSNNSVRELSYSVMLDLDNDGIFETDITDSVMSIDNIIIDLEVKKTGTVIGRPSSNKATLTLENSDGRFSPNNPNGIASELENAEFRINTKIQISAGFIDSGISKKRELFTGVITKFGGKYNLGDTKMVLELSDFSKFAKKKKVPNHDFANGQYYEAILFDVSISDALNYLIDYCYGTGFGRSIQTITTKLPVIEFNINDNIWSTIQKLNEAANGQCYFDAATFVFKSQLSPEFTGSIVSYNFTTNHIFNFTEDINEENIINRWKITSNAKTLQPRTVLSGTPSQSINTVVENYTDDDGKDCLGVDNKTITLKYQLPDLSWVSSWNVPLVDTQTYSDLLSFTQADIDSMNQSSTIKVWDKMNDLQLIIYDIDVDDGTITLLQEIDPDNYDIQITYQYYMDRILFNHSRWFEFKFDKSARFVEMPLIEANDSYVSVVCSNYTATNTVYLSDYELIDGNTRVKFKLTNNVSSINDNRIYITKIESWGNTLECINELNFIAEDGDTIDDFENSYEITNDYILDPDFGQRLVDAFLDKYKRNITIIEATCKGFPQVDLLDLVTVTESKSGIDFSFKVIGIKHNITLSGGWKTNLTLQSLISPWSYDPAHVNFYSSYKRNGEAYTIRNAYPSPSPPTNLRLTEQTYVQPSGELVTKLHISFTRAIYDYYSYSLIQISTDNVNWFDEAHVSIGNYNKFNLVVGVRYYVRIQTVGTNDKFSTYLTGDILIGGKDIPPSNVSSLVVQQVGNNLTAIITPCLDPDINHYELKMGSDWDNSYPIKIFKDNITSWPVAVQGTQNFLVKAVDNIGQKSVSPATCMITIIDSSPQNQPNIVFTRSESLATWSLTGAYIDYQGKCQIDSVQTIGSTGYFADMFSQGTTLRNDATIILPTIDLGIGVIDDSSYFVDWQGNIQYHTTKVLSDFTYFADIFQYPYSYMPPTSKVTTFLNVTVNYNANSNNFIGIKYRVSFDNIHWGEWSDLTNNQFLGRYVQIKLLPISINQSTNVSITGATVTVTAPTIVQTIENILITSTSGATHITFPKDLYALTSVVPFTVDSTGKVCNWRKTNETTAGFDLDLLDSGNNRIQGTLTRCDVRGY